MKKVTTVLTFENTNLFALEPEVLSSLFNWFSKAHRIHFSKVNFAWDNESYFVPISGDYEVLGELIEIRQYGWLEFMELIRDTKSTLYFATELENTEQLNKYFNVEYISRVDYPSTVTLLENLGLVKTKESESFIATDPRVFSVLDFDDNDASQKWYEVDILGTPYGNEITADVVDLFDKYKRL